MIVQVDWSTGDYWPLQTSEHEASSQIASTGFQWVLVSKIIIIIIIIIIIYLFIYLFNRFLAN